MTIRSKSWFALAIVATLALLYLVGDRLLFLRRADRTVGDVVSVEASNGRCGSRRDKHDCTRFDANVRYEVDDKPFMIAVTAGSVRGHDQPLSSAAYAIGSDVDIAYNRDDPDEAYRDTWWDIWTTPVFALFMQVAALFNSTRSPKGSRRR